MGDYPHVLSRLPATRRTQRRHGADMRGPSAASAAGKGAVVASFKRGLLRNLLRGLQARAEACSFGALSLQERKRAVKWPKAVLAAAAAASSSSPDATCEARRSRFKRVVIRRCVGAKRMRRGCYAAAAKNAAVAASSDVARRLVRRRTMALRKVIPGGDAAWDEAALLREAVDYVVHLRAQVDVLRRVSAAVQQRPTVLRDPTQSMGEP
ncbi:hypothetical protein PVAP13_4NG263400 [Panicum virgatum]|uniref:BHLH domain-containing protein n=1 Tax=Panicum virgatum TaxID=38727 RepID=A0A8T0T9H0_PANVG|nr:hypothetical protein PVAP13_4NG263400 [Panicum virgatum]